MSLEVNKDDEPPKQKGFLSLRRFRDLSVVLLLLVISFRLAFSSTNIDLSGFNFTDLLSLILAVSAIALSAAFYFKADESSRSFYNNTYHFTKEVSEILGRIEAGFGQQLAHINEGYTGLSQKLDGMPFDQKFLREQEEAKKAEIQEQEAARDNIIDDLMRRAQVHGEEKDELNSKLAALQKEVELSREKLRYYRSQDPDNFGDFGFSESYLDSLARKFSSFVSKGSSRLTDSGVRRAFRNLVEVGEVSDGVLKHLSSVGLMADNELTDSGISFFRSLFNRHRSPNLF